MASPPRPEWPEPTPLGKALVIEYNGIRFRRYPKALSWTTRNYYRAAGNLAAQGIRLLHQEVWKATYGPIPPGHDIHHKDHNPLNNRPENLDCISRADHYTHHNTTSERELARIKQRQANLDRLRHKAAKWHGTDEGHAWHSQHGLDVWQNRQPQERTCDQCGKAFLSIWARTKGRAIDRFCSNACKSRWRRAQGLDNVTRTCERCGQPFTVNKYQATRFCSRTCAAQVVHTGQRANQHTGPSRD